MTGERVRRVLWLTKGLGLGGAERLLATAVGHVDPERFAVEVAYVLPWKDAFVPAIRDRGVAVHCLGATRTTDPRWAARLRRLVRHGGFDLVHTHSPVPAVAVRIALGARRPALVHTEHNVWTRYRWPTYAANAASYGRNAAVIAVSQGVADSVRRPRWARWVALPPMTVLHHGIDEQLVRSGGEARSRARALLGLDAHDQVVGTVANFTPKKDQRSLLAAVQSLVAGHDRLRLVLIGSGPLEQALRVQAQQMDLGDRVLFTGARDDVQTLLPAFDVFALSSLHEGLPIALLEAMAAGIPCVATRVGGVPEAMTHGAEGLLVPPSDSDALAAAIAGLLDDSQRRAALGAAAARTAARFSIAHAVRVTEGIYADVLGAPAARTAA